MLPTLRPHSLNISLVKKKNTYKFAHISRKSTAIYYSMRVVKLKKKYVVNVMLSSDELFFAENVLFVIVQMNASLNALLSAGRKMIYLRSRFNMENLVRLSDENRYKDDIS